MEEIIKNISQKIHKDIFKNKKEIATVYDDLKKVNIKGLIIYEFLQPHGNTYPWEFMFYIYDFWKNLSYKDWLDILDKIKNYNLGTYCYLPFFYKYFDIDLIRVFFELEGLTESARNYTIDTIRNQNSIFSMSEFDYLLLQEFNIYKDNLEKLSQKLLNQGAIHAIHPIKDYPLFQVCPPN